MQKIKISHLKDENRKHRLFPDCFPTCMKCRLHQIYIGATINIRNITSRDTSLHMSTKWDHKQYKNHIQDSSRPGLHHTGTVQAFVSMGPCKVTFIYVIWKIVNNILVYGYFALLQSVSSIFQMQKLRRRCQMLKISKGMHKEVVCLHKV